MTTEMKLDWEAEKQTFTINSARGAVELIPDKRNYILEFAAVTDAECHATLDLSLIHIQMGIRDRRRGLWES